MDEDDDAAARKFFEESERLKRGANRLAAERANQNSIDAALAQIDEEDQEGEDAKDSGHDLAKIHVTFFPNFAATTLTTGQLTLTELAERVRNTARREKNKLPWLKLAVFGSKRTGKNCLRNDANVIEVSGVELDYDLEQISFDDAVAAVRELEIHALLYTSASHTPETPRWRALAPFSKPLPPAMRAKLTARLNGALKAKLNVAEISKSESFALSQSYYFGWINTRPSAHHRAEVIEGKFIGLRDYLAIYEASGEAATAIKENSGNNGADSAAADWGGLAENIRAGTDLHASLRNLSAKLVASGMAAPAAINLLRGLMENSAAPRDERWQDRRAAIPRLVESAAEKFRDGGPQAANESAPSQFDSGPVDLWGNLEPPMLPRGILPKQIEDYAFVQAETMGVDPGGVAMAALAVCAAATPDTIELVMKRHSREWTESARLWVGLVGPPSTKKSPIISATIRPLAKLDAELLRNFLFELKLYEQMEKDERKNVEKPVQKRLRLEDTTIEGAQDVLAGSPNGVLLVQDELSGFFGSMDKYSGYRGAAKDRGFWLQSYNGGPYALNRVGRGAGIIPNLSVTMLGGVQPDVIRRLSNESYDDGFLQRMLLIVMRQAGIGKDVSMPSVSKQYARLIEQLTKLQLPVSGSNDDDNDGVLRFDNLAQEMRSRLEAEHLKLMQIETVNRKLAAHIGKYDGLFGRLCVAFHCIEHAYDDYIPEFVTEDTAKRVATLMREFLLPHATAFYSGVLRLADDHDRLAAIAGYILARQSTRITNRDVQRGDRTMRKLTRHDTDSAFEQLEALGWVMRTAAPRLTDPPHWIVNPAVHQRFAARAKQERERREATAILMKGLS